MSSSDRQWEFFQTTREATFKAFETLLKTIILINGGAAVAILTFVGTLAAQNRVQFAHLSTIANALLVFAFGVLAAIAAMALNYLTLYATAMHTQPNDKKLGWLVLKRISEFTSL